MYDVLRLKVLAAIVVTVCILSPSSYCESDSAFTHQDILTVLLEQEGRINDFLLEFDSKEVEKTPSGVIIGRKRENIMLMAKGSLFRTRRKIFGPQTQELISDKEYAGDGSVEYFCDRPDYGTIRSRPPEQCITRQSLAETYLLCVKRNPRMKGNLGFEGNLIGALEEDPKGIKISEEFVDGRKIVVLTRFSSPGVGHSEIRLDPQMNFAVLSTIGIGANKDNFKSINSDFLEVTDGIWLPRKVERVRRDKTSNTRHETITVNTLKFNNGYGKDDFRIRFPPGARVIDLDANMVVTLSPGELDTVYLDPLLSKAVEQNSIDVYHVNQTPGQANSAPSALEDANQPDAILGDANEASHGGTGRSRLTWKMVVTFLLLGLAGTVYVFSKSASHNKKT